MPGFNAGMQPFSLGDSGSSDAGMGLSPDVVSTSQPICALGVCSVDAAGIPNPFTTDAGH